MSPSATAGRWMKLYGSLISGDALTLHRDARLLAVEAEYWSDMSETDGRIPRNALRMLTDAEDPLDPIVEELVAGGYWKTTDSGWQIVGFLDRHDSSDDRDASREVNAARLRGWRLHRDGRHNADGPRSCPKCMPLKQNSNADTNDVRNAVRNSTRSEAKRQRSDASDQMARSAPRAAPSGLARDEVQLNCFYADLDDSHKPAGAKTYLAQDLIYLGPTIYEEQATVGGAPPIDGGAGPIYRAIVERENSGIQPWQESRHRPSKYSVVVAPGEKRPSPDSLPDEVGFIVEDGYPDGRPYLLCEDCIRDEFPDFDRAELIPYDLDDYLAERTDS